MFFDRDAKNKGETMQLIGQRTTVKVEAVKLRIDARLVLGKKKVM